MSKSAKPDKPVAILERLGDGLCIVYHKRDNGIWFMSLWLIGWTAGCVSLAYQIIWKGDLSGGLFAIPVWGGWVVAVCVLVVMLCKREVLELDRRGLRFTRTVLIQWMYREVPLAEVRRFTKQWQRSDDDDYAASIHVQTVGTSFNFARKIDPDEADWLIAQLNEQLAKLRADQPSVWCEVSQWHADEQAEEDEGDEDDDEEEDLVVVLHPGRGRLPPPSDCRWQRMDDSEGARFIRQGRWSVSTLGWLLGFNGVWNGVVGLFAGGLWGEALAQGGLPREVKWWVILVCLIPCGLIGAIAFVGLLRALFAPWSCTTWTLGPQTITCRREWLGIGVTQPFPVASLDRVELREAGWVANGRFRFLKLEKDLLPEYERGAYRLVLIEKATTELCTIDDLSEGEARYMGDVILRERPEWFR